MSRNVKFSGEIVQQGKEFVVKTDISFPTQDEAQQFGAELHDFIKSHFEKRGARLKREEGRPSPVIIQ